MSPQTDLPTINSLESLFKEFYDLDTPSYPHDAVLTETLNVIVMEEKTISFKTILDSVVEYTENEDWKRRVFGLFLLTFMVKHDRSLHDWFYFAKVPDKKTILTQFWKLVTDPNPRVQAHVNASDPELTRIMIDWTWWQVTDYRQEKIGYHSNLRIKLFDDMSEKLPVPEPLAPDQYLQIDFENLIYTLPPLEADRQAAYFWRTITLLLSCINKTSSAQIGRLIQQLIETSLQVVPYNSNDTSPRTNHPWNPSPKQRPISEFPPIWRVIFSNYHHEQIYYLFFILWGQLLTLETNPTLFYLFFDANPYSRVNLEAFDEYIGNYLACRVVQLQDKFALQKLIGQYQIDDMYLELLDLREKAYQRLFSLVEDANWEEGTYCLIMELIREIIWFENYREEDRNRGQKAFTDILVIKLIAYLDRNAPISNDLIALLLELYQKNLERLHRDNYELNLLFEPITYQNWKLTADLYPQLVRIGRLIAQHQNLTARDQILTVPCFPLLQGVLEYSLQAHNISWSVECLSTLLNQYTQLGEPRLAFFVLTETEYTEEFEISCNEFYHQYDYLQFVNSLIHQKIGVISLWQEVLKKLFSQHGIELLRFFGAILGHMIQFSDNWMKGLEQIGAFWQNLPIQIPQIPSELEIPRIIDPEMPWNLLEIYPLDVLRFRILRHLRTLDIQRPSVTNLKKNLKLDSFYLEKQLAVLSKHDFVKIRGGPADILYYSITKQGIFVLEHSTEIGRTDEWTWWRTLFLGCATDLTVLSALQKMAQTLTIPLPIRKLALLILTQYQHDFMDYLLPLHQWHPIPLRIAAIQALAYFRDSRGVDSLVEILRDESIEVRKVGTWALGEIRDCKAVPPLLRLLNDREVIIQIEAIRALGKLQDERAIQPLLAEWETLKNQISDQKTKIKMHILTGLYFQWHQKAGALIEALYALNIDLSKDQLADMYQHDLFLKHEFT